MIPTEADELVAVLQSDGSIGAILKSQWRDQWLLTGHAMIQNNSGLYLITQRRSGGMAGMWDIGVTETLKPNESYITASRRALEEKLGIMPKDQPNLKPVLKRPHKEESFKRVVTTFEAAYQGQLKPNPNEIAEIEWVSPAQLCTRLKIEPSAFRPLSYIPWMVYAMPVVPEPNIMTLQK